MDAVTYPKAEVISAIHEGFVPYKINMLERHPDFKQACDALHHVPSLRVVVLKAEGRGFCSGMDLMAAAHRPQDKETLEAVWAPWAEALDTLEQLDEILHRLSEGAHGRAIARDEEELLDEILKRQYKECHT